jgi:tetratricopeptide (TPR) repeat protein
MGASRSHGSLGVTQHWRWKHALAADVCCFSQGQRVARPLLRVTGGAAMADAGGGDGEGVGLGLRRGAISYVNKAGGDSSFVAPNAVQHKLAASALFVEKAFVKSSFEYQLAIDVADAQLRAVRDLKQKLTLNKARALYQAALGADVGAEDKAHFLDQSLRDAKSAVELNANDAKAQYTLGRVALELGEKQTAVVALRKAQQQDASVIQSKKVTRFLAAAGKQSPRSHRGSEDGATTGSGRGAGAGGAGAATGLTTRHTRPQGLIVRGAQLARSFAARYRGYAVVAAAWWLAGAAAKAAGHRDLGDRIHRLLTLALAAAGALLLQSHVQQQTRYATKRVIAYLTGAPPA